MISAHLREDGDTAHVAVYQGTTACGVLTMPAPAGHALTALINTTRTGQARITQEAAAHVLWHVGEGGVQPPAAVDYVIAAVFSAEADVLDRLRLAVPEYVEAVGLVTSAEGARRLRAIAGPLAVVDAAPVGGA